MSALPDIPVLQTERLTLRAPAERDFQAWVDFYARGDTRYVGGPIHRNVVWRTLAAYLGHWAMRGYGMWAVEERATGTFCGNVGLWFPEGWPEAEIGWTLLDRAVGRGIAFEAAAAAREHAYGALGWDTVISLIDPANARSIRLAERLGATLDGHVTHAQYGRMAVYRHPGPTAAGARADATGVQA
ncbi:MAG: GNAT family N-acetyltransferase [Pseudomonadota bacterium]